MIDWMKIEYKLYAWVYIPLSDVAARYLGINTEKSRTSQLYFRNAGYYNSRREMDMVVGDSGIFEKFAWGSRRDRDRDLTPLALNFRCLLIVKLKYSKIYANDYQHMVKEHDCQVITAIKWSQICQSTVCPIYVSTHALDFHACIHILKLCIIRFASNTCQFFWGFFCVFVFFVFVFFL